MIVPGSTANLGGGFDTLGVALQLYLRVRIVDVRDDGGAKLTVVSSTPPVRGRNIVERAFEAIAQRTGRRTPTVLAEAVSEIPVSSGLGSSAAAAVAGVRLFERLTGPVSDRMMLSVAAAIEGHADNAAPSIYGGMTSVIDHDEREPEVLRWEWPEELRVIVATPSVGLSTRKARAALSDSVSRKDAIFNLQRVLSLVHALQTREYGGLREAVKDRWHQPARAGLVPLLGAVLALEDPEILGAFLSGAGPSVALLARREFPRLEQLLKSTYERAGSAVTVRTLVVHQSPDVAPQALHPTAHAYATGTPGRAQGRTV